MSTTDGWLTLNVIRQTRSLGSLEIYFNCYVVLVNYIYDIAVIPSSTIFIVSRLYI